LRTHVRTLEVKAGERYGCLDLTTDVVGTVDVSGIEIGCAVVYCMHTTCAVIINEWEDGALEDFADRLRALVPEDTYYAHDDLSRRTQNLQPDERVNGSAHVAQMLLGGTSHVLPVVDRRLVLGRWQRLFLVELDEPTPRNVMVQVMGE
jgi:secondary thiamine-phosphate synthase enzyme